MSHNTQFLSIVARLMASENVAIIHDPAASTASFDLVARRLTLPVYAKMSDDLYEMLLAHEVGHALWTPLAGWHKSLSDRGMGFKSFLNVVEDVRIERKIKQKFPGVTRKFHSAYQELLDLDFFGLKGRGIQVKNLPFIDRLNIASKVGPLMGVPFSEAEERLVEEAQNTETFEEVQELAGKLYDRERSLSRIKLGARVAGVQDAFGEGGAPIEGDGAGDEGVKDDGAGDEGIDAFNDDAVPQDRNVHVDDMEEGEDLSADKNAPTRGGGLSTEGDEQEPTSITDKEFRERENQLAAPSTTYWSSSPKSYIFNIRDVDLNKFVAPASKVVANILSLKAVEYGYVTTLQGFLKREEKAINHLVNDFTLKQNAHRYAHAQQGKSGKLDMKNLHNYKLVDDIFLRTTKVPKGKNHGMVLFFDQSGSMEGIYRQTIQQMIIMIEFCRRLSIPVEVYGFSDAVASRELFFEKNPNTTYGTWNSTENDTDVNLSNHNHLKQYISSGMSAGEYMKGLQALWMITLDRSIPGEQLYSTPLNTAIVLSRQITRNFVKATNVDVTNVIFLTDGDASDVILGKGARSYDDIRYVCDGQMTASCRFGGNNRATTAALVDLMKRVTGANYIGVFLTSQTRTLNSELGPHNQDWLQTNKPLIGDPKNDNFVVTKNYGFDSYFITKRLSRPQQEIDLSSVSEKTTTNKLSQVFSAQVTSLAQSRAFLSMFASEISSAKNL